MSFAERLGELLRARAPKSNLTGYWAYEGDAIGVHEDTYKNWYYGYAEPGGENIVKLIERYGATFGCRLLEPYGLIVATKEHADLANAGNRLGRVEEAITELTQILDDLRTPELRAVE